MGDCTDIRLQFNIHISDLYLIHSEINEEPAGLGLTRVSRYVKSLCLNCTMGG